MATEQTPVAQAAPSPIAGIHGASPAETVRSLGVFSPAPEGPAQNTPLPPTPTDPGFMVTPSPPAFQGFNQLAAPNTIFGQTPNSSPVAFGSVAATPTNTVLDLSPPVEGEVYGDTPTPPVTVAPSTIAPSTGTVFAGFGPSPLPTPRQSGSECGLSPPPSGYIYAQHATPEPLTHRSPTLQSPPATANPGLRTPTWNTPTAGQQADLTPRPLQDSSNQRQAENGSEPKITWVKNSVFRDGITDGVFGLTKASDSPLSMPLKKMEGAAAPADQTENQEPVMEA